MDKFILSPSLSLSLYLYLFLTLSLSLSASVEEGVCTLASIKHARTLSVPPYGAHPCKHKVRPHSKRSSVSQSVCVIIILIALSFNLGYATMGVNYAEKFYEIGQCLEDSQVLYWCQT
jgi:hypothetical protein